MNGSLLVGPQQPAKRGLALRPVAGLLLRCGAGAAMTPKAQRARAPGSN
jgi:hypothetical protein